MEIQVPYHEHPLTLSDERDGALERNGSPCWLPCPMCYEPINGLTYSCSLCPLALHKWCAELPSQLHLPLHPHPLSLSFGSESEYDCGVCHQRTYCDSAFRCSDCEFRVHLQCAVLIRHSSQIEKLKSIKEEEESRQLLIEPMSETVNVGGLDYSLEVVHSGVALCENRGGIPTVTGYFWCVEDVVCEACDSLCCVSFLNSVNGEKFLHVRCAFLPQRRKHPCHRHDFSLTPVDRIDDPDALAELQDECYCNVCEQELWKTNCLYYCAECKLVGDISCTTIDVDLPINLVISNPLFEAKFIHIFTRMDRFQRMRNRKSHIAQKVLEEIEKEKGRKVERGMESNKEEQAPELEHFLHHHPLKLFNEPINYTILCRGCFNPVYGMTYICARCEFYLHLSCAQFPRQIRHQNHPGGPGHRHALLLDTEFRRSGFCNICQENKCGLFYECKDCDEKFSLELNCANFHEEYTQAVHEHRLEAAGRWYDSEKICQFLDHNLTARDLIDSRIKTIVASPCFGCGDPCAGGSFSCPQCEFVVHGSCCSLKPQGSHPTHRHRLVLNHHPEQDDSDEYYCNACEEERDGKLWVYSCPEPECDYHAHIACANPMKEMIALNSDNAA